MLFHQNTIQRKTVHSAFFGAKKKWMFSTLISFLFLSGCHHLSPKEHQLQQIEEKQDVSTITAKSNTPSPTPSQEIEALLKAEFTLQREGPSKAFSLFYNLTSQSSNIQFIERLNHIALASQNDANIERSTDLWLAVDPTAEQAYSLQLQIFIKNNRPEDITRLLINAIQHNVSLHFLPHHLETNSRDTSRVDTLNSAIMNLPLDFKKNEHILLSRAHIFLLTGEYQSAIDLIETTFKSSDAEKKEALYLVLAFSQKNLGMTSRATNTLVSASKRYPESARIPPPLIDFHVEQGNTQKAIKVYKESSLSSADKLQIGINFIRTLLKHDQAYIALNIIRDLPKDRKSFSDQILFLKALALADSEQKSTAITVMSEVDGNLHISAAQQMALWLYDENSEEKINDMVLKRIHRENMQEQVMLISNLHEEKGRFGLSYELLTRASHLFPESNPLRYRKALLADSLGHWTTTESELTVLLQKDPNNPQYLNALGYTILTRTERIDDAMIYIEKAYEIADSDPAIIDSLGWGHFLKGELDQASYFLKKAWRLLQDDEIAAHYGESLWKQRHYEQAIEIWKTALQNKQNTPLLIETIKRLSPSLLENIQQDKNS